MGFQRKILRLIVAFVIAFSLFGWLVFNTLNELKVNGHYYRRLVTGKDLVADVLPPPEYILEEFLVVHQLADPAYRSYLAGLEQKHEALHRDFEDRHKFWAENLPETTPADKEIRQAMLVDAYTPAQRFFQLCQDQFLPLVHRSDYTAAAQLLHGPLQENYETHRVAIDQVVALTNTRNQVIEAEVDKVVAARLAILGAFGVAIVVGLTLGLVRFVRGVMAAGHQDAPEKAAPVAPSPSAATPATPTGSSSDRQFETLADVVNNLANQVHILTFNAATEAARTSEQARDFSAVAAEIRQSSTESRKLAEGIQALLGRLAESAVPSVAVRPPGVPAPANVPTDGANHISGASD